MRELHLRDCYTELGEQIDAAEDMESFLRIRLEMATLREENATAAAEGIGKNYAKATACLEEATSKRIYWEGQLQKVQAPTRSTTSHTITVNANGASPEAIDQAIQKAGKEVFQRTDGGTPVKGGKEGAVEIRFGVKLPEDMSEQEFRRRLMEAGNQILQSHRDLGEYR